MKIKIAAIACTHGQLPDIQPVDLLLIAGDICPVNDHSIQAQAGFIHGPFADWLDRHPAKQVIGIAGNHDLIFESEPRLVSTRPRWRYLQDAYVTVGQLLQYQDLQMALPITIEKPLKIWGTPWQPVFYNWAFNLNEQSLAKKWSLIPDDIDVLVTHCPPYGIGDMVGNQNVGSPSLLRRVKEIKPKLHVFGHIHEGHGRWELHYGGTEAKTTFANCCIMDEKYQPIRKPQYFEIET